MHRRLTSGSRYRSRRGVVIHCTVISCGSIRMIMKVGQNFKLVILRSCVVIFLSGMSRIISPISRTILVLLRLARVRCLRDLSTAIFSEIVLTIISNLGRLMIFPRDQHPCSITWFGLCSGGVRRWLRRRQRTGSNCRRAIGVRDVHCAV
nr:hypothetical protein Iba_chr03cCG11960 [Ipomoea batatas]